MAAAAVYAGAVAAKLQQGYTSGAFVTGQAAGERDPSPDGRQRAETMRGF